MKTILVTGASTGIGFGTAVRCAELGYQVFAGVRKTVDGEKLRKANSKIKPLILDVTKDNEIQVALKVVELEVQGEFSLVNNAGIAVAGPVEFVTMDDYRRQFDINFFGLVAMTKAFLPLLRKTQGRVVNISSIAGKVSSPFLGPYSASKFAVEAVSDSLRREVAPHRVKVILIEPGPIATPIWDKGLSAKDTHLLEPTTMNAVYGSQLKKFKDYIAQAAKTAVPVERVLDVIELALTSSSPQHRYLVGKDKGLIAFVPMIPSKLVDRIMAYKLGSD